MNLRLIALIASLGPSSVSFMISHISMLSVQFSLGKLPSVADSETTMEVLSTACYNGIRCHIDNLFERRDNALIRSYGVAMELKGNEKEKDWSKVNE